MSSPNSALPNMDKVLVSRKYLLDTNIFISALKCKYYGFELCPGFWEWLELGCQQEQLLSIDMVRDEIKRPDSLCSWIDNKLPANFFKSTSILPLEQIKEISECILIHKEVGLSNANVDANKVQNDDQKAIVKDVYSMNKIDAFVNSTDAYLIAYAKLMQYTLVTMETRSRPESKIKIPVICDRIGVECINLFELLQQNNIRFVLDTSSFKTTTVTL
ncbi:MAG: DUF4411 family protein [Gammaproteobacteria bacterium]|nr:DUF4411 family protein [Gammaproteobacteria bacterium]